jgi:hypothetical protein
MKATRTAATVQLVVASLLTVWLVRAQTPTPQFNDYSATEVYKGKNAPLALKKEDRIYRTRLRAAAIRKPNFAGHYILTAWGCGALCLMGAVIDANSGNVNWLPHTICCWSTEVDDKFRPIEYRLSSRLIIFSGERNEKADDDGTHYYYFEGGKFIEIKSIVKEKR